jgi:hypothetical protein
VANLSLLSEFSKAIAEVADWWSSVEDDLAMEESTLLALGSPQHENDVEKGIANLEGENCAWWSEMKDEFQEYYDVVRLLAICNKDITKHYSRSMLYICDFLDYFHHQSQLGSQWVLRVVKRPALPGTRITHLLLLGSIAVRKDTEIYVWEVLG